MSSTSIKLDKKQEEIENLYNNKFNNFVNLLGSDWPLDDIHALIETDVYHGDLRDLLDRGCSKELSLKILL